MYRTALSSPISSPDLLCASSFAFSFGGHVVFSQYDNGDDMGGGFAKDQDLWRYVIRPFVRSYGEI